MPTLKDTPPAPGELTTEQKERTDAAYLQAVNDGLSAALVQADSGELVPADEVWAELGAETGEH